MTGENHESMEDSVEGESYYGTNEEEADQAEETQTEETNEEEQPADESSKEDAPDVEVTEENEYSPNYKYKVLGQEMEIPENLRAFIKDAETEKTFRELFEKAGAVDHFKGKTKYLTETQKELESKVGHFEQSVEELRTLYSSGDMDGFFQKLEIPEEKIMQWAIEKAKFYQLPEHERAKIQAQKQQETYQREAFLQNQREVAQYRNYIREIKTRDVEATLQRPDVVQYAQEFDKRAGKPNAFVNEMIRRGKEAWDQGQDLSAMEVAQSIMNFWRFTDQGQPSQAAQSSGVVPRRKEPPVLPNVSGRSSSAVKGSKPTSIEELRKMYETSRR